MSTQDFSCGSISGYYTILRQNDGVISKGFTPATFTLNGGQQYAVEVQDYGAYAFDHWKDTQSTTRNRQVSIAADTIVTAIYKNLNNPSATGPCSISSPPSNDADFSISASPSAVTVLQAGSSSSTIAIASLNDFSSAVSLSASSISGVTATFSANPITPASNGQARSVLVISASPSAAPGIYQLTVTGSSGSLSHSTTMSITIGQQQKSTKINVNTADSAGNPIFGYYTTLWQNGNVVQTAFSPAEFAVNNGETYQVAVADYGSYVFDHWSDGSTDRFHSVIAGDSLTAVYRK